MNPSTIIPCGNTILLQPEKQAEQTTSGILLTNTARPFIVYTILAVGGGALTP
jgi:co-chaperonin GroES (HSP10)